MGTAASQPPPASTVARTLLRRSRPSYGVIKQEKGARHERHNLEGTRGEAGLDAALRYRVDGRLFNRDYPARASVGKRSGVTPTGSLRDPDRHRTPARVHLCRS